MRAVALFFLASLFGGLPAQSREASRMALEHHTDACMGLTPAQCCAQMLEIATFRATGDQVPRAAETPLRLSCETPTRTFPETSCRLIAMARGFNVREAKAICAPAKLTKRCSNDNACRQCMTDLDRLEWRAPQRACYALTYVPPQPAATARVIRLRDAAGGNVAIRVERAAAR